MDPILITVLRDVLGVEISPLTNNVAAALSMVLYFKIAIEAVTWFRLRYSTSLYSKQLLHITLASSIICWSLFDDSHWSWRLNTLLPSVMMARYIYKGAILKDPEDLEVLTLSRTSSPSDLLFGSLQFAAVLVWLGLYQFRTAEAAIIIAALGVGDGIAPMVGHWYGRHDYQMPLASQKTMEGSVVGVFLGTVVGCYLYMYLLGIPLLPLRIVLAYGGIAAVVEGTAPGNLDNLTVPIAIHFSLDKVQEWLPA